MFSRIKAAFAVLFGSNPSFVAPVSVVSATDKIRGAFADPRFMWRSLEALHTAGGLPTVSDTRHVLASIGARRSELSKEVYTLDNSASTFVPVASGHVLDAEAKIREAFADPRFTWRSLGALVKASGLSESETVSMLENIGAQEGTNNLYHI